MLLMALVLLFINIIYAMYYLAGAREVKRLESNSRSPMFELFGSTLSGVGTIRYPILRATILSHTLTRMNK